MTRLKSNEIFIAHCCEILAYISSQCLEFQANDCLIVYTVLRDLPEGENRPMVARSAMTFLEKLVMQPENRRLLRSFGIEKIIQPYVDNECGFRPNNRYELGIGIMSTIYNYLHNVGASTVLKGPRTVHNM